MSTKNEALERLVINEISDFTASLGQPGAPETPEDIHCQLMGRVRKVFADVKQQGRPDLPLQLLSLLGWTLLFGCIASVAVYGLFWILWDALK